jgi:hypothetical protein
VPGYFAIGEEAAEMWIFEGIVEREWNFVDVKGMDELFWSCRTHTVISPHA